MKKRLFLLVTILFLMTGMYTVSATEVNTGLKEPQVYDVPEKVLSRDEVQPDRETATGNSQQDSEWDKYANHYYYNQLSPQLQKAWDELDAICEAYFEAKDVPNFYDVKDEQGNTQDVLGYTESVSFSEPLTQDEVREFWGIYIYSNPQYYFLANSYMSSGNANGINEVALVIYDAFWDGDDRAAETEKVKQQLSAWQTQIDACTSDAQKLQKIQDIICAKVTYNYDAANDVVDEQISFSQSPYSVICMDSTVCAGYADTFYMLCNASGIDTISVTSPGHQWSKARINGSWYNFDVTWDDNYTDKLGYSVYKYHGRSDAMYDTDIGSNSASNIANHQEEAFWETYIPACLLDSAPTGNWESPGTFAAAVGQVASPRIMLSYEEDAMWASVSCDTESAKIYYTTDGTDPSICGKGRNAYTNPFKVTEGVCVKAMAVLDAYQDSEISTETVELIDYNIEYYLDGGVNHSENPTTYTLRDKIALKAPVKTGYMFDGWYEDTMYQKKVTGIVSGSSGVKTFYAKWTPITYDITFSANGGSGSVSTLKGCKYDATYTLSSNAFSKTGYTFAGWNTKADGSGTAYADKATIKNLTTQNKAVITLYAQWKANSYTIKYNGNKATSGKVSPQKALLYGKNYKLSANKYKRTGYKFTGWNTKKNGKGTSYKNKASVKNLSPSAGGEVTLYAQWKANKYNVKFHGNGATSGSMKVMKNHTYDKNFKLSANKFKRKGYKFVGWNTKKNGKGKRYKNKAKVKNLTSKNGKTVTLYAQWKKL